MSYDMDYMIVFDKDMNMYIVSNFEDNEKNEKSGKKNITKKNKNLCSMCNEKIQDESFRATFIKTFGDEEINTEVMKGGSTKFFPKIKTKIEGKEGKEDRHLSIQGCSLLCEECKQKLTHTENYLYNY